MYTTTTLYAVYTFHTVSHLGINYIKIVCHIYILKSKISTASPGTSTFLSSSTSTSSGAVTLP